MIQVALERLKNQCLYISSKPRLEHRACLLDPNSVDDTQIQLRMLKIFAFKVLVNLVPLAKFSKVPAKVGGLAKF